MTPRNRFLTGLAIFVALYFGYGVERFSLGVDFTDEGEYVSWPMIMLFGERPFAREIMTLLKPIGLFLFLPLKLHPAMTLYEFRLLGWGVHLLSFSLFSFYLFALSNRPVRSLLIASVPVFVCNIFGIASPSYNMLSSDFLLMALSLGGMVALPGVGWKRPLAVAGGLALFIATLAHPALGLIAVMVFVRECTSHRLFPNLARARLEPSNWGILSFATCWFILLLYLASTGALTDWMHRAPLTRSFAASSLSEQPLTFYYRLFRHPFSYSWLAVASSLAVLILLVSRIYSPRVGGNRETGVTAGWVAFILTASLIVTFSYEPDFLSSSFAQVSLILVSLVCVGRFLPAIPPPIRFLVLMSALGAVLCATFTYYFSPYRSWVSGILALPFAFGVGLTLLLNSARYRPRVLEVIVPISLALATACVARNHHGLIFRDAQPNALTTPFRIPKLRHILSTEERVLALNTLYDHLHPRIAWGEALLVYDECPMLYFLFDASSAYGWAGAKRYNLTPEALTLLDREFGENPLPEYAIRTLVDVGNPVWRTAPRTNYDNYPLNETVMANYVLERTIFPFEVWRLKTLAEPPPK